MRIEPADQLVELERGLPNVAEQAAARASAPYAATAIDGGVVTLVLGATALELPGSDFQTRSRRGDCRRIEDLLYPAARAGGAVSARKGRFTTEARRKNQRQDWSTRRSRGSRRGTAPGAWRPRGDSVSENRCGAWREECIAAHAAAHGCSTVLGVPRASLGLASKIRSRRSEATILGFSTGNFYEASPPPRPVKHPPPIALSSLALRRGTIPSECRRPRESSGRSSAPPCCRWSRS
jgi:hypothetical protein